MFTLEDVEAAVEATGLTPHAGDYVEKIGRAYCYCPASILVVATHGKKAKPGLRKAHMHGRSSEHISEQLAQFGVSMEEIESFAGGVDGSDESEMEDYFDDRHFPQNRKAYDIGQAVRKRYSLT